MRRALLAKLIKQDSTAGDVVRKHRFIIGGNFDEQE